MKRDALALFIKALFCIALFIVILSSCMYKQKTTLEAADLPKAYWNQEDHDKAIQFRYSK